MDLAEIREALTGPFASISTPFTREGAIDVAALAKLVDHAIAGGSKALMLTHGDSLYTLLTDKEVADVTRAVVERADGRAMVIAADNEWWTGKAVSFAKHCARIGADILMLKPPDWVASCTPETLAEHYASVGKHIPVMVVTNVFTPRGAAFGLETLQRVLDRSDRVLAVKDDMHGAFARQMALLVHDRMAVVSGGQKQNHLALAPYGCNGYLSTFITLKPEVAHAYWQTIRSGDMTQARAIIARYDMPFFDYVIGLRGSFDAGMHGALELLGLAGRWRRPPYYDLSDGEMEDLAALLRSLDVL